MTVTPATEHLLSDVERTVNKRFRHRAEIGLLVDALNSSESIENFERLIFYAKFITHAGGILARSGMEAEETRQLAQEYSKNVGEALSLLRAIAAGIGAGDRGHIEGAYLGMSQANMNNAISLFGELSWIKNYLLDSGKPVKSLVQGKG